MPGLINRLRVLRTADFDAMEKMLVDSNGCRLWTGPLENGTRTPYYKGWRVKKELYIHRHGNMPQGHKINMTCKNGICCSDSHMGLTLSGGGAYNVVMPDTRGTLNANNILTEDEVREIRKLYAGGGISYRQLGEIYIVDASTIGLIVRGEHGKGNWTWLK